MPLRSRDYEGVLDQATLAQLQEIFDAVWSTVIGNSMSRDELARLILEAHKEGLNAEGIKSKVMSVLG